MSSPLAWLMANLEALPGVTVATNGTLLQAGMRGRPPVYIGWSSAAETFAWHSGGRRAGEGEPLSPDPVVAAEQVMTMLTAQPDHARA